MAALLFSRFKIAKCKEININGKKFSIDNPDAEKLLAEIIEGEEEGITV